MCTTTFEAVSTLYNANDADNDTRQLQTFVHPCKSQNKWELNLQPLGFCMSLWVSMTTMIWR